MQRLDPETDVGEANQCNYGKSIPAKPLVVLPLVLPYSSALQL